MRWGDIASSDAVWVRCYLLGKSVFWANIFLDCHCTAGNCHFSGCECRIFHIENWVVSIRPVGMHTKATFQDLPRDAIFPYVFSGTESALRFRLGAIYWFVAILWALSTPYCPVTIILKYTYAPPFITAFRMEGETQRITVLNSRVLGIVVKTLIS